MIEPFKYMIQPVAIERDDEGKVVREIPGEVLNVYSIEQATTAIMQFEQQLATMTQLKEAEANGSGVDDNSPNPVRQSSVPG